MLAEKYHIRMPYHDLAASRKMQAGSDGCKTDFFRRDVTAVYQPGCRKKIAGRRAPHGMTCRTTIRRRKNYGPPGVPFHDKLRQTFEAALVVKRSSKAKEAEEQDAAGASALLFLLGSKQMDGMASILTMVNHE